MPWSMSKKTSFSIFPTEIFLCKFSTPNYISLFILIFVTSLYMYIPVAVHGIFGKEEIYINMIYDIN